MSRPERRTRAPQPRLRAKAVLVLALLAGVLGMHGLAPAPAAAVPAPGAGAGVAAGVAATGHTAPPPAASHGGGTRPTDTGRTDHGGRAHHNDRTHHADRHEYACHDEGQGHTPHGKHADQHCASATVPGPPVLTGGGLAPAVQSAAVRVPPPLPPDAYAPSGGRAPPTLAELQLLRI